MAISFVLHVNGPAIQIRRPVNVEAFNPALREDLGQKADQVYVKTTPAGNHDNSFHTQSSPSGFACRALPDRPLHSG